MIDSTAPAQRSTEHRESPIADTQQRLYMAANLKELILHTDLFFNLPMSTKKKIFFFPIFGVLDGG